MDGAIVTVGDELLAVRTANTNATWLSQRLTDRGVRIERVTTVPDRVPNIADTVDAFCRSYDAVVVTGGIGPTHDDVTMAAVASAFDRPLEPNESVLEWLAEHGGYEREDLTTGTADLPVGGTPIHNPVGVAPGVVLEGVYVLPGVPAEMKAMFERVASAFAGTQRYRRVVDAAEPESALLDRLETLREQFPVSVGSYPGETVTIAIEGEDRAAVESAADWLTTRVDQR